MVYSGRTSALKSQKNSGNFRVAITGNIVETVKINFIYDYRLQKEKLLPKLPIIADSFANWQHWQFGTTMPLISVLFPMLPIITIKV